MTKTEEKIKQIIDNLKPYLMSDGGNIKFIKLENDIVYIELLGACSTCPLSFFTLKEVIETSIKNKLPNIKEVKKINNN